MCIRDRIDTSRMKAPAFKMILTATGEYAYRRPEDLLLLLVQPPVGSLLPLFEQHPRLLFFELPLP